MHEVPSDIAKRVSERQVAPAIEKIQARIAEPEKEVEQLRSSFPPDNDRQQGAARWI